MTLAAHAQKQAQAATSHDILIRRLDELRRRKDLLVHAFVYKRALDQQTYREQLDKLNEDITLMEIEEQDARFDEVDVEAALDNMHSRL